MRRCAGSRWVRLYAEQEMRRDQHGFNRHAQTFLERISLLARSGNQPGQLIYFPWRDRAAIGAARQISHDLARASAVMMTVQMPTAVQVLNTVCRWPLNLSVGTADFDRADPGIIRRNYFSNLFLEFLSQLLDLLWRKPRGRVEFWRRRHRSLGRIWAAIAGGQPLVKSHQRNRYPVIAG